MPREVKIEHIRFLLKELSRKTGDSCDHYGFGEMSEKIGGSISQKYLYENLQKKIEKASEKGDGTVALTPNKLDELAKFLGHENFNGLISFFENPVNNVLSSCVGNYYSFVRRSSVEGAIYRSPVKVTIDSGKVWLILKGPNRIYNGQLVMRNGCLFCLMESRDGKVFHHVYRIAAMERPDVLLGVFSGILTAQEPIAGRAVLIRKEETFTTMTNEELSIEALQKSGDTESRLLASYFEEFSKNNLQVNKSVTFRVDDLRSEGK